MAEKRLSKEIAEEFLKDVDSGVLHEFNVLASTAAEVLSNHRGDLFLHGLKSLSDSAAQHLSQHSGFLDHDVLVLSVSGGRIAVPDHCSAWRSQGVAA